LTMGCVIDGDQLLDLGWCNLGLTFLQSECDQLYIWGATAGTSRLVQVY
jgi:hypothetical protein